MAFDHIIGQEIQRQRLMDALMQGRLAHAYLLYGPSGTGVEALAIELAKAVNFGLLYGQSAGGLVKYAKSGFEVDLTYEEAVSLHEKFFAAYQGLKKWHKEARAKAGSTVNEVRTLFGRRKLLPPHNEETFWSRFSAGFLNMVVQGTCADGLKQAMVQLADRLPKDAQMIGTVHDELIVECPTKTAKKVCQLAEDIRLID